MPNDGNREFVAADGIWRISTYMIRGIAVCSDVIASTKN